MIGLVYTLVIGIPLCLMLNVLGCFFVLTIIGIPLGLACFQMAGRVLTLR
jgi:uncharacterized membrane protein YccF (DUF307 family)